MTDDDEASVVRLVPRASTQADDDRASVAKLFVDGARLHEEQGFIAAAVVMVRGDGITFVGTQSRGQRALLLGAVTDLQYSLAKQGDEK